MNYTVGTQKMNTYCKRRNKFSYRAYIMFSRKKYKLCLKGKIFLVKNIKHLPIYHLRGQHLTLGGNVALKLLEPLDCPWPLLNLPLHRTAVPVLSIRANITEPT